MKEYWESLSFGGKVKFVSMSLAVLIVLLFTIFNWQDVKVSFVFFSVEMPLTAVILICIGAGYLLSTLLEYSKFKKRARERRLIKDQMKNLK